MKRLLCVEIEEGLNKSIRVYSFASTAARKALPACPWLWVHSATHSTISITTSSIQAVAPAVASISDGSHHVTLAQSGGS